MSLPPIVLVVDLRRQSYHLVIDHCLLSSHLIIMILQYAMVSGATRKTLTRPTAELEALAARVADAHLSTAVRRTTVVYLRTLFFPLAAELFHELVFDEPSPPGIRDLIVASAENVIAALKCTTLRDMALRGRLTAYLETKLADRSVCVDIFPEGLSLHERALHLQGVFFHTGAVQMTEAMEHLSLALAQHPAVLQSLRAHEDGAGAAGADPHKSYPLLDRVLTEALRCWPLFGVAHRITSAPISIPGGPHLPTGSVVCFNYPEFHNAGYKNPDHFLPSRWERRSKGDVSV